MSTRLDIFALEGIPLVQPGDDLAAIILAALSGMGERLKDGDVVVLAQKIVSKSEGRLFPLADVEPSAEAVALGEKVDKDPRLVELILRESNEILRTVPGVLIVEHKSGIVMANAGIDRSNVEKSGQVALLLPVDADASARALRDSLVERTGTDVSVVIADSVGRAWRYGTTGLAIGCAGIDPLWDQRGDTDMFGKVLEVTEVGIADQVASAANLVMGEATEGRPAAIVRGLDAPRADRPARVAVRTKNEDLFR
ncbi:MAG: coenzyme F420-0:L-glutamate ligase [Proteobacteria bacterium]|nr:coenzyme F420-0:L-glutamate ligase [Pseudomonadota bacterium]